MDPEPLTVRPDDLLSDVADEVKEVHYRAAVAVDAARRPIGLVTRTDLVGPRPRRVILVDHAEQAQSVPGVEQAEIVEILDHHHIGSIETKRAGAGDVRPGRLDGDAGDRALPPERDGAERARPRRVLLGAILSDTVILNSPTATERDRGGVEYLERVLEARRRRSSAARCSRARPTSRACGAEEIVSRDAKEYEAQRRADAVHRPGGDGRPGAGRAPRRSCWARWRPCASGATTRSTR